MQMQLDVGSFRDCSVTFLDRWDLIRKMQKEKKRF